MGPSGQNIVFFDGVCNLCNRSVQRILKADPNGRIKFASLQSDFAEDFLRDKNVDPKLLDSILFFRKGKVFTRSGAVLRVAWLMRFPWPLLSIFLVIPYPVRDWIYDWIAANRYKWFGKKESCWLPDPAWKDRFID